MFFLLPRGGSFDLFRVLACVSLLCYGGGFGTMPAFAADYFGAENVGTIYGLMLTAWGAGACSAPCCLAAARCDRQLRGGLQAIAAIMVLAAVLPLLVRPPRTVAEGAAEPVVVPAS